MAASGFDASSLLLPAETLRLQAAVTRAEMQLRQDPSGERTPSFRALEFIKEAFAVFVGLVCEEKASTPKEIPGLVDTFLSRLTRHAFALAELEPEPDPFNEAAYIYADDESFEVVATKALKATPQWMAYLAAYQRLAEAAATEMQAGVLSADASVFGPLPLPRRLEQLLRFRATVSSQASQKEVAGAIEADLKVKARDAQAYAALIRPDDAVANDGRAARHRKPQR